MIFQPNTTTKQKWQVRVQRRVGGGAGEGEPGGREGLHLPQAEEDERGRYVSKILCVHAGMVGGGLAYPMCVRVGRPTLLIH